MKKMKMILVLGLAVGMGSPSSQACDVVKIEANMGNQSFGGSAVVLKVKGKKVLVTADHVIPTEETPREIRVIFEGKAMGQVRIAKRDWSTDLMVLSSSASADGDRARDSDPLAGLQECVPSPLHSEKFVMKGYPLSQFNPSKLEAILVNAGIDETRTARPMGMYKVMGLAEIGMSGGALLSPEGKLSGMLLQEWCTEQGNYKGGVFAVPVTALSPLVGKMLVDSTASLEMPLPFKVNRAAGEISANGFKFRSLAPRSCQSAMSAQSRGGHPDGIGGLKNPSGVEVVGLSGQPISRGLEPMGQVLKTALQQPGVRMVVRRTVAEEPLSDLMALARMLILGEGEIPNLPDYSLISGSTQEGPLSLQDFSGIFSQVVVESSLLVQWNPGLEPLARLVRSAHERWMEDQALSQVAELYRKLPDFKPYLESLVDHRDPQAWKTYLEFQTNLNRMRWLLKWES